MGYSQGGGAAAAAVELASTMPPTSGSRVAVSAPSPPT